METSVCTACLKPKAAFRCGACDSPVCKKCAHFIDAEDFSYFKKRPDILSKDIFCNACYGEKIEPLVTAYEDIMARAREVYIFDDTQGKESREFRNDELPLKVEECADRDETVLRLAFLAAEAGFNGLLDLSVTSEKVRNHAFQNLKWRGSGIPVQIDPKRLNRNKAFL